jgi:hypothetical protein
MLVHSLISLQLLVYLSLSSLSTVGGLDISLHVEITGEALSSLVRTDASGREIRFSPGAIRQIKLANMLVDIIGFSQSSWHFDNELFRDSSARLLDKRHQTVVQAASHPYRARYFAGVALHTIQDFYSHSNWIESGQSDIFLELGRNVLEDPSKSDSFCSDSNPAELIAGVHNITTGYFTRIVAAALCFPPPYNGKCNHGFLWCPGINKDSKQHPLHDQVFRVAVKASIDYINQILNDMSDAGDDDAIISLMGAGGSLRGSRQ